MVSIILAVAAAFWSGYWVIGSHNATNAVAGALSPQVASGWAATFGDVRTRGFPNRFDTTITALELTDHASGLNWAAPFFQILRLSYNPNHLILIFPDSQVFGLADQRISVTTTEKMQASAVFEPRGNPRLARISFVAGDLALASDTGWTAALAGLWLAVRKADTAGDDYELGIEANGIVLPGPVLARFDPASEFSPFFDRLALNAVLTLDAPMDRAALGLPRPSIIGIELRLMRVDWGRLSLSASGSLSVDSAGYLSGQISVEAKNWRPLAKIAQTAGWFGKISDMSPLAALDRQATVSGSLETLTLPLRFVGGKAFLGQIPLGSAPWIGSLQRQ